MPDQLVQWRPLLATVRCHCSWWTSTL